jgi:hypothetical protein
MPCTHGLLLDPPHLRLGRPQLEEGWKRWSSCLGPRRASSLGDCTFVRFFGGSFVARRPCGVCRQLSIVTCTPYLLEPFVEVGVHGNPVTCIPSYCYLVSSIVSEGVWYRRALATFGLGFGLGSATRAFGAPAVGIPLPSAFSSTCAYIF